MTGANLIQAALGEDLWEQLVRFMNLWEKESVRVLWELKRNWTEDFGTNVV